MQVFRALEQLQFDRPTVLTIGTFDGIHRGHQDLLNQLRAAAQEKQAQSAVLTFHPRPKTVLAPHLANSDYLTTPAERVALFAQLGLDALILIPFTLKLAQTPARDFIKLLVERLNVVELCVGHDFALGKNREGDVAKLTQLGQTFNYSVREIEPLKLDGQIISSTQIREALREGQVRQATYLLGRYPALTSQIIKGARRGHTIGFPTANLAVPPERLLPANGVYATFIQRANQTHRYPSVTNVGVRPSFDEHTPTVETFIFDFDENIYGQTFTLEFVEHLRPEMKFNGVDQLVAQIQHDADQARALLAAETVSV